MSISWTTTPGRESDLRIGEAGISDRVETADFDAFVHATGRHLHRAALLLCGGDHHLAEDLTQATYTKVYLAWGRVSRVDNPVAYARSVLTRTYLSHRRLRRSGERATEVVPEQPVHAGDATERLDLMGALALLSAQDRAVLVLRYWLDLDVAQTAHLLGVREAAVRQRARRALVRLRVHVPDLDPESASSSASSDPFVSQEHR